MSFNIDTDKIQAVREWLGTGSINLFGMPFSGKDTQCERLAELLNASTFGGGDILRNSPVPEIVKTEIDKGNLAPTDDYISIVVPYFLRPEFANRPLVLSSVGRWLGEEGAVIAAASDSGHPIKAAVFLVLDHEQALSRLHASSRDRADDDEEILNNRFDEFANKTKPVLDIYRSRQLLLEVDGSVSYDEVTTAIIEALFKRSQQER